MSEIRVGQTWREIVPPHREAKIVDLVDMQVELEFTRRQRGRGKMHLDYLGYWWRMAEPEPRTVSVMAWEPTETEGAHKDGRFVELCCGEIQGRAHTIVGRWNIDAQDRAGWYGTDGTAITGATHWRELSALPGRE